MKSVVLLFTVLSFGFTACKKEKSDPPAGTPQPTDPDDGIIDPEFPAGINFPGTTGCVASIKGKDDIFPVKLSQTGCFTDMRTRNPVTGALAYSIRNAFFSGKSEKERYMLVPAATKIERSEPGTWKFPVGAVALKTFTIEGLAHETRILVKTADGLRGATYKWNLEGTEADWIENTTWEAVAGMDWVFPAQTDCIQCHTAAAGDFLGWETRQINTRYDMYDTGHQYNQIQTLDKLGLLAASDQPLPPPEQRYPKLDDQHADETLKARTWIHLNCAYCHMPDSSGNSEIDLRFDVTVADMKSCGIDDMHGDLGVPDSKILVPGNPDLSNFYLRMINPDISVTMPLYSTMPTDPLGADLVKNWISSLKDCEAGENLYGGTQKN